MTVVPTDASLCPTCGAELDGYRFEQPAPFTFDEPATTVSAVTTTTPITPAPAVAEPPFEVFRGKGGPGRTPAIDYATLIAVATQARDNGDPIYRTIAAHFGISVKAASSRLTRASRLGLWEPLPTGGQARNLNRGAVKLTPPLSPAPAEPDDDDEYEPLCWGLHGESPPKVEHWSRREDEP